MVAQITPNKLPFEALYLSDLGRPSHQAGRRAPSGSCVLSAAQRSTCGPLSGEAEVRREGGTGDTEAQVYVGPWREGQPPAHGILLRGTSGSVCPRSHSFRRRWMFLVLPLS